MLPQSNCVCKAAHRVAQPFVVACRQEGGHMAKGKHVPKCSEPHSRRLCLARLHANAVTEAGVESFRMTERQCAVLDPTAATKDRWDGMMQRRKTLLAAAATLILITSPRTEPAAAAELALQGAGDGLYVSTVQGYQVRIPAAWTNKGKAGADMLWEDPDRKSTSVGVTVNPVRVKTIEEFGTLDQVGSKLLAAEKAKDSTLSVAMVSQDTRQAGGALLYDYEYELNSTRGRKRILNTVTIFQSKLFILNAAYKCEKATSEEQEVASISCVAPEASLQQLRDIAASFRVLS